MSSDETKKKLRKVVLLPLSKLYGLGVGCRNKFYDWGLFRQNSFDIPVITVGNLSVGGTGKTPHTEFIVRLLRDSYNIGILSRGYKRHTKGFVLATPHSTPRDIGDEPYQMYHKFSRKIMVAVCENRVEGINRMLEINPSLNLIILDDGFQHRRVKPKVSVLLTEFSRPYYNDDLLPYGNLRESPKSVSRADIIIVTKCPSTIKALDYRLLKNNLNLIPEQKLFFSRFRYEQPRPVFPSSVRVDKIPVLDKLTDDWRILAVCGIGNPRPFLKFVKSFKIKTKVNVYPDHHEFTRKDMETLLTRFESLPKGKRFILTTEKDAVRFVNNPYFPHALKPYIFFIPIHVSFDNVENTEIKDTLVRLINKQPL